MNRGIDVVRIDLKELKNEREYREKENNFTTQAFQVKEFTQRAK
jgi:hypothetical protein